MESLGNHSPPINNVENTNRECRRYQFKEEAISRFNLGIFAPHRAVSVS